MASVDETGPRPVFRLGAVPGATPGTWIATWRERMRAVPLELVPIAAATQRATILAGEVDAALVRLPLDRSELHVIPLYEEVTVAVMSLDSSLTVVDELTVDDLAGEVRIVPDDDVLDVELPGMLSPTWDEPVDTAGAIAIAASGTGVVVVPMSLARAHHRRDVTYRPVTDAATSSVGLAWVADRTSAEVETFIGIVRGRTAHSSRR